MDVFLLFLCSGCGLSWHKVHGSCCCGAEFSINASYILLADGVVFFSIPLDILFIHSVIDKGVLTSLIIIVEFSGDFLVLSVFASYFTAVLFGTYTHLGGLYIISWVLTLLSSTLT